MPRITYLTGIEFGAGAISTLSETLEELGIGRPLLVADRGVQAAGLLSEAVAHLPAGLPVFLDTPPNPTEEAVRDLDLEFPPGIFSLSHVALPFPLGDSLYGMQPDKSDEYFGVHLGALAPRGERGVLIVNLDALLRVSSNPFLPYVEERMRSLMVPATGGKP